MRSSEHSALIQALSFKCERSNMDSSSLGTGKCDDEAEALQLLLEAFGSFCSLEEIASAYCKASCDVNKAGELLCQLQGGSSEGVSRGSNGETSSRRLDESLNEDNEEYPPLPQKNSRVPKQKKITASMGTVSSVLGKAYVRPSPPLNEQPGGTKPIKIELDEPFMDEYNTEPVASNFESRKLPMRSRDVADFLFSMLGDGFNLSMDAIQEILGQCGYNAKESMEELLALSEKTLGYQFNADTIEFTDKHRKMQPCPSEGNSASASTGIISTESSCLDRRRCNLSREVMEALFTVPERTEEEPKRTLLAIGLNRKRAIGKRVVSNYGAGLRAAADVAKQKPVVKDVAGDEDKYQVFRGAAKQNWDTMKAYYEAAIDAFTNGDRSQAGYLLEQGNYYFAMAREANEKSSAVLFEARIVDEPTDLPLDLHLHHPKEALHLLKLHLRTLSRNPSFRCLKIILDVHSDVTKGKRKRMVTKFLEKESIKWTEEEGNPGTILIPLDVIDLDKLGFVEAA